VADNLITSGSIQPMIIVTPEGNSSYWINQANRGPRWGDYVSQDLVQEIDSTYRTVATREDRAIGGVSMGAHGALQLAMNTNEFGVVGAHSLVLRKYEEAFPIFGDRSYFDANDPVALCNKNEARVQDTVIWIDIGQDDKWRPAAEAFHQQLVSEGLLHSWHVNPGGHDGAYWSSNLNDYLKFYSRALAMPAAATSPASARAH
jgi:S-formylglutathione hydrolase FrmB